MASRERGMDRGGCLAGLGELDSPIRVGFEIPEDLPRELPFLATLGRIALGVKCLPNQGAQTVKLCGLARLVMMRKILRENPALHVNGATGGFNHFNVTWAFQMRNSPPLRDTAPPGSSSICRISHAVLSTFGRNIEGEMGAVM